MPKTRRSLNRPAELLIGHRTWLLREDFLQVAVEFRREVFRGPELGQFSAYLGSGDGGGWSSTAAVRRRHVLGLRGMASSLVLAEEIMQYCRYSIRLTAVVWGGVTVPGITTRLAPGRTRLRPSSEAVRLRALLEPPSKRTSQESGPNRSSAPAAALTV